MEKARKYKLLLPRSVLKTLHKSTSPDVAQRILRAIGTLRDNPRPPGARALQEADGLLRVRIGDYRVVYRVLDAERQVKIVRISHRSDVYRKPLE